MSNVHFQWNEYLENIISFNKPKVDNCVPCPRIHEPSQTWGTLKCGILFLFFFKFLFSNLAHSLDIFE